MEKKGKNIDRNGMTRIRSVFCYTEAWGEKYIRKICFNLRICALWIAMSVLTGLIVGAFSSAFAFCLAKVTGLREEFPYLLYFLPVGGVVIVFLYHLFGAQEERGPMPC